MTATVTAHEVEVLLDHLREAVRLGDPAAITERIKHDLEMFSCHGVRLPERFRRPKPDGYSRRLLHRDSDLGFTALIMTWGPGQHTALHDHAGIWCVEGVIEGEMEVSRYDLTAETAEGICHFTDQGQVRASVGSAGSLIPPFEYHVLANAHPDQLAITLHVYGGEMDHCSVFEPLPGDSPGRYQRQRHPLRYDA
ncbi:MAG TPA: cysteine dioxygenase family protein [Thermoanaerobaculia bacterium]|jgi:predicted metal-dependent enzyme (double-stranded beta helix superfamily)|nr:cysteine dioxygenase family protein [Thermoanaerobaculia bacterium]